MSMGAATKLSGVYRPVCPWCRLHFVTNLSVAGGLLLLVTFGAGRYTVDAMLKPKKKE